MSKPAVTSPDPPGAQPSGAAVNSSTNAAIIPGRVAQAPAVYFKTLPGILKIASVVLGLSALAVTAYAYNNGVWFHPAFIEDCDGPSGSCERRYEDYYFETFCKTDARAKSCPTRWLVTPQMYIIAFAWVGTLIVLIVLIFIDLSKKPTFTIVDMVGHLVAGGLAIVSGLCLFGFCVSVWIYDLCGQISGSNKRTLRENGNTTASGRQQSPDGSSTCEEIESWFFKQWHVLVGAIFAGAIGVLYIVIGIISLKPRRGQQVRPMMVGQFGAPVQTQSAPYRLQGYGSTS